jgi:hypothetical protein
VLFWTAAGGLLGAVLTASLSRFASLTSSSSAAAAYTPKQIQNHLLLATGGTVECAGSESHRARDVEGMLSPPASTAAAATTKQSSPLEMLYVATDDGTNLKEFVRYHALRTYPSFPDQPGLVLGNPSVAHDPATNRTVLGFRIENRAMPKMLRKTRYLMLCEMAGDRQEMEVGGGEVNEEGKVYPASGPASWRCQDSGVDSSYVPPECDARYWRHPAERVRYAHVTLGPEDARLFLDENGDLGATVMMRGCHPHTKYGNSTALWSVYTLRWKYSHGAWRLYQYPKVLDLRTPTMDYLGNNYPIVTKSWVSIPGPNGNYAAPSNEQEGGLRFSVGWTRNMEEHVVYKVKESYDTLSAVVPANVNGNVGVADHSRLDLGSYRASTNFVHIRGALLGMGHRQRTVPHKVYDHYWYAFCPREPYHAVALSDTFALPVSPGVSVSFALGLAVEGPSSEPESSNRRQQQNLYVTWSEHDRTPRLTRFSLEEVLERLRNSTFARSRGSSYLDLDDYTALCTRLSDKGHTSTTGTA